MNDPRFLSLRRFGSAACVVAGLAAAVLATGCGGPLDNGRHRVSGRISFAGKPVTHGEIVLTPDGARGNSGPQGIAPISDGRYDTAGTRAPGVAPGPVVARVTALAGPRGPLVAEYEVRFDVAPGGTEYDIEIPAEAEFKPTVPVREI
jgi:hypothetical protein